MLTPLNFPIYPIEDKTENGKMFLFDCIRLKWVVFTPEEWVRQNMIHFLINHLKIPKSLISVEKTITYQKRNKRFDILVMNNHFEPLVIVECKAPEVKINNQVFLQIAAYNHQLKAPYSVISNGLSHFCFKVDFVNHKIVMLVDFPSYEEMVDGK